MPLQTARQQPQPAKERHELEKRRANERILEVEQGLLTPLVFSASEAGSPQPILPISSSWCSTTGAGRLVNQIPLVRRPFADRPLVWVTSRINGRRMGGVWFTGLEIGGGELTPNKPAMQYRYRCTAMWSYVYTCMRIADRALLRFSYQWHVKQ